MRLLLIVLAIIWGLGILDQDIKSNINNKFLRVNTYTWQSADATSLSKDGYSVFNISSFFGEEDGDEEDGDEDNEDGHWSVLELTNNFALIFNFPALRSSFSLSMSVADAHLDSPFNPPDVILNYT